MKKYFVSLLLYLTSTLFSQEEPIINSLNTQSIHHLFSKKEDAEKFINIIENPHYEKKFPLHAKIKKESLEKILINHPTNNLDLLTWISQSALKEENYKSEFLENNKNMISVLKLEDEDSIKYDIKTTLLYNNSKLKIDTNTIIFRGDIKQKGYFVDWTATSIGILKYYEKEDKTYFSIKSYTRKNNIISTVGGWFNIGCDREPVPDSTILKVQLDVNKAVNYLKSEQIIKKAYEDLKNKKITSKNHELLMNVKCIETHNK
ncbi:hypothetical protein K9L97_02960 [Candidatus Woesearchaeota archaeon]|nr:hypothetical protein [Candidatus Woesearchaeota archaeon]